MAPCPKCGANLAYSDIVECPFDPSTSAVQCQQCGTIFPVDDEGTVITEDIDKHIASRELAEFVPVYGLYRPFRRL